jgi:hypothetical protein
MTLPNGRLSPGSENLAIKRLLEKVALRAPLVRASVSDKRAAFQPTELC